MTAHPKSGWMSPSLMATPNGSIPAFEHKFVAPPVVALEVLEWANERLRPDPHAEAGPYRITTVYFDTPEFDVYRRSKGYAVNKYRIRRYGQEGIAHLERKSKQDGRVWKCRTAVSLPDLSSPPAGWFNEEVTALNLQPVCRIVYDRNALVETSANGPFRLTFDRAALGTFAESPLPDPVIEGQPLFENEVVLEMKFLGALPTVFKELMSKFALNRAGLSKYRHCAKSLGLAPIYQNGSQA